MVIGNLHVKKYAYFIDIRCKNVEFHTSPIRKHKVLMRRDMTEYSIANYRRSELDSNSTSSDNNYLVYNTFYF